MVEFTKNIDGLRLSTYFYKDRNIKRGAIAATSIICHHGNAAKTEL